MSLEDLDKVIAESDPSALDNIEGVRKIASEIGPLEVFEVDPYDLEANLAHVKGFKAKFKLKAILLWIWLRSTLNDLIIKAETNAVEKWHQFKDAKQKYRHWPVRSKLLLQGAIALFIVSIVIAYLAFVKKTLFYKQELFLTSFEQMADKSWDTSKIDSHLPPETFYNSSRISKNIFKLKKIVVNIQPSESSGPNPMVAFEFSLEGNSSEVLLEIKDREGEILDQVQRTIEAYSFDEINDIEGKKAITEKVRMTINRILTLGKIRRVYIQGIILKP
jgi:flagellar basal body-associated protein FliL